MNIFQGMQPELQQHFKKREEKQDRKESLFNSKMEFIQQSLGANAVNNPGDPEPKKERTSPKPFENLKDESRTNLIASFLDT